MSATTARRLVTAGSLSLALALASPAAAFAQGEEPERGSSEQAQENKDEKTPKQGERESAGSPSSQGSGGEGEGKGEARGERRDKSERKAGGRAQGGDPRGNNGTVKIDGEPFDSTPGNEPHVGCTFQADFFGFDAGDTALVTLTGHAPTGGGLLYSQRHTISTDAAGGGRDVDESITFTAAQLGLFSITPHPQQGWHIKLAADVDSAPGGAKQKVFWVKCAQPVTTSGTTTDAAAGGGDTTVTKAGLATGTAGAAATAVVSARSIEQSAPELTLGAGAGRLTGTTTQAAAGAGGVSAQAAARPSVLPFTGTEGLAYLLALGAAAVGVGTAAHRLGRRRASVEA